MPNRRISLTKRIAVLILYALTVLAAAIFLCACSDDSEQITSFSQLGKPGTVIAIATDTPESFLAEDDFPDAVIQSYTDIFPTYMDVANGKVDAVIYARRQMELAIENGVNGELLLDDNYCENKVAVALSRKSPIPGLQYKINRFLRSLCVWQLREPLSRILIMSAPN